VEEGGETNPVLRAIRERRSIRSVKDKPVQREVIRKIN
jgi:nitroreductase